REEEMRSIKVCATGVAIAAMGLVTLVLPNAAMGHDVAAEIEKVRLATIRFNDVKVALAEGFIPAPPGDCVDAAHEGLPAHWGGMGIHYINPKMLKITQGQPRVDGKSTHTDFIKPAILLYEPQANGSLKLVGVENLVFMHAWQATGQHAPPKFAGRTWYTMADNASTPQDEAHRFEPHHDQHIYFKKTANPSDQLKPFSPSVTCEHFKETSPAGGGQKK
ncbi:MAG: hypothetical protein V3R22_01960, partial [Kiloniellales bacterium]